MPMSSPSPAFPPDEPLALGAVVVIARRRFRLLAWPIVGMTGLALLGCLLATPRYRATAEIEVQKEQSNGFGLQSTVTGQAGAPASGDSLDYNMTLQTEAGILHSPALALAVIEAVPLENTPDYFAPRARAHGFAHFLRYPWKKPLEPLSTPLREAPDRRAAAERIFQSHLKVLPVAGTRLIDISYADPDPARAAATTNAIARTLADISFQQHFTATVQGSQWLAGQIDQLKAQAEQATARAASLQRGTGMFGNDASRNVVLERLDSLNQTLTAAESNRILKESIDRVALHGSPELISSLSGNSSNGSVASINTSLSLIQELRAQEAVVRADLGQSSMRYGPAYPRVAELKAQLAEINGSIQAEIARLGQRAHTDWQIASQEEQGARAAFEHQKKLATAQNDTVIAYQLARQEAVSSRDLYEGLLIKLKQTSLLEGLRANEISIVSAATTPADDHPSSPNPLLWLGAAVAAGVFAGVAAVAFAELVDRRIFSLAEAESAIGATLLAVLPALSCARPGGLSRLAQWASGPARTAAALRPGSLIAVEEHTSDFSEAIRSLRDAAQGGRSGEPTKVILITSCLPGEGKTTIAVNLAATCAMDGSRVLLVDGNLRRPVLHRFAGIESSTGLALALSGPAASPVQTPLPGLPNFKMLCGDQVPPAALELLRSPRLGELITGWRTQYDVIILDSPSLLPASDALLLSRHSDAVLLVARHGQTTFPALRRCLALLQQQPLPRAAFGVVLNDLESRSAEFNAYFGYAGGAHASAAS